MHSRIVIARPQGGRGNLAVPGGITGKPRRKRNCLPEIAPQGHFLALRAQGATSAVGLLAMTNLGAITVLATARANRSCSAGPGCPLPYRASAVSEGGRQLPTARGSR